MNGFIRQLAKGLVAASALLTSTSMSLAEAEETAGCSKCGFEAEACKCGHGHGLRWKEHLREKDWEQVHPDHCWPDQYNRESRRRVNEPLGRHVIAGNMLESTIWIHQFNDEDEKQAELNEAGRSRLRYLMRRKPYVIRQLYLQTSFDPQLDAARKQAIITFLDDRSKALASSIGEEGASFDPWMVAVVNREPGGMFGTEARSAINKMTGVPPILGPAFQGQIKNTFGASSGVSAGGGGPAGGAGGPQMGTR